MKAIDRIFQYIDYKSVRVAEFERENSISNGYLAKMRKRSASMGEDILNSILENSPDINPEWLLTGSGPMLKEDKRGEIEVNRLYKPRYTEKTTESDVPLYNIDAAANLKTLFDSKHQNIIDHLRIPDLPKCDGAIYIRGDSMYPLLKAGDIVIYKEVSNFEHLIYGEIYLIDYNLSDVDYLVIKYVKRSEIPGYIQLVSYNSHHDPIDIPILNCVRAMALIKASVRLHMMM